LGMIERGLAGLGLAEPRQRVEAGSGPTPC
jgi:hypothetical protein